ncbi:hypothetical protein ABVK25_001990 [Lepraria finkii]|uniref:Uncharacterized protein n=1 Tax=Lepraria finkii TaxID=1340010 RepID=A0ABR4BKR6_9LECA
MLEEEKKKKKKKKKKKNSRTPPYNKHISLTNSLLDATGSRSEVPAWKESIKYLKRVLQGPPYERSSQGQSVVLRIIGAASQDLTLANSEEKRESTLERKSYSQEAVFPFPSPSPSPYNRPSRSLRARCQPDNRDLNILEGGR